MIIRFTIFGNHVNPKGNPVPYTRTPYAARWRPDSFRYYAWKDYVVQCFQETMRTFGFPVVLDDKSDDKVHWAGTVTRKPILIKKRTMWVYIDLFWANEAHGDPDNIWKGIVDSLFVDDRNVYGSFFPGKPAIDKKNPRVEIKIVIPNEKHS